MLLSFVSKKLHQVRRNKMNVFSNYITNLFGHFPECQNFVVG